MMFLYRRTVYYQFHEMKCKISKLKFLLFEHVPRHCGPVICIGSKIRSQLEDDTLDALLFLGVHFQNAS